MATHPETRDRNEDPITGAPGAHPVGTGIGAAAGGAATGAVVGSFAGPVGTAVGIAAGAVVGGLAGKAVAEQIDPTAEDAYWRDNYRTRPYVDRDTTYDEYGPAYRYGWESYPRHAGRKFDEAETDLRTGWERAKDKSKLTWDKAKHATRDAWDRVERAMPGDFDRDGR
jgi:phage tail tape-measure protein